MKKRDNTTLSARLRRRLGRIVRGRKGGLLLETVVALSVFGLVGPSLMSGIQTSYQSKTQFDIRSRAENIVRNEMESVFAQAYKPPGQTYATATTSDGFTVTSQAIDYSTSSDSNLETVRVTVQHQGLTVKVLEAARTNR